MASRTKGKARPLPDMTRRRGYLTNQERMEAIQQMPCIVSYSLSLYNYSPNPGWSRFEDSVLRCALVRFGVGSWRRIVPFLPGKTFSQLNMRTQRMLGQQSLAALHGLKIDPIDIKIDNKEREGTRKNGILINTGRNVRPEERKMLLEEKRTKYELVEGSEAKKKLDCAWEELKLLTDMRTCPRALKLHEKRKRKAQLEVQLMSLRQRLMEMKETEDDQKAREMSEHKWKRAEKRHAQAEAQSKNEVKLPRKILKRLLKRREKQLKEAAMQVSSDSVAPPSHHATDSNTKNRKRRALDVDEHEPVPMEITDEKVKQEPTQHTTDRDAALAMRLQMEENPDFVGPCDGTRGSDSDFVEEPSRPTPKPATCRRSRLRLPSVPLGHAALATAARRIPLIKFPQRERKTPRWQSVVATPSRPPAAAAAAQEDPGSVPIPSRNPTNASDIHALRERYRPNPLTEAEIEVINTGGAM